jgi:predicted aspartyl protease
MIRLPILYVDRPGFTSNMLSEKSPVIDVVIGFVKENSQTKPKLRNTRALIDTGADDIFVDERLLIDCGCPRLDRGSDVRTVHGTVAHHRYLATMLFPDHDLRQEVEVISTAYEPGVRAYEAVFGTRFLELGVLVIDPQGESHFTFHQRSTTSPDG